MAEVDTSSYPKDQGKSALELASDFASLHRQGQMIQIGDQVISKNDLDLANNALQHLTKSLVAIGPNGTPDQYRKVADQAVEQFGPKLAKSRKVWDDKIQSYIKPDGSFDSNGFFNEAITAGQSHTEALGTHVGQYGNQETGNGTFTGRFPTGANGKFTPQGFIAKQLPATQQVTDDDPKSPTYGQPRLMGPPTSAPPILPVGPISGVAGPSSNFGPPGTVVTGATAEPPTKPALPAVPPTVDRNTPRGPAMAPPPAFNEGLAQRNADQITATQKMSAVKPLILAWPKIQELERSGPGTPSWNDGVAFLKAWNIIPTAVDGKDPTQVYQEVNKYLNQYVSRSGTRSDADLSQKEMSNPNISKQILPALKEITRNTVAQERIEASRPGAFRNSDYSKYGEHASQYPQSSSIEAAGIDLLPKDERTKLFNDNVTKAKKGDKTAIKFLRTLDEMRKQKMHDLGAE